MVEGSARARLSRSANTRTIMAAQQLDLKVNDEVDFYRMPTSKDTAGWFGPAIVADVSRATRGIITVRWQSRVMEVQLQDIRRHLHYLALLISQQSTGEGPLSKAGASVFPTVHDNVWTNIKGAIEKFAPGIVVHVGHHHPNCKWISTAKNKRSPELMGAVTYFGENAM